MATYRISRDSLTWFVVGARRVLLSAWAVALVSCGGGQGEPGASVESVGPTLPAPTPALQPTPAPAQLVVGTPLSIDGGVSGGNVRVALSANGDGFAVWQIFDGEGVAGSGQQSLRANRYDAAAAAWGSPINIDSSSATIPDFDLTVDASGNATVLWHERSTFTRSNPDEEPGVLRSVRFDASSGEWTAPVALNTEATHPRVASDATGTVLAVYVSRSRIRGRFFDPVSGTWQPEAAIEQNRTDTGFSARPVPLLDGSGNALAVFSHFRPGTETAASNYFSRNSGGWGQLDPSGSGIFGEIPDSLRPDLLAGEQETDPVHGGPLGDLHLATSTDGNFLLVWAAPSLSSGPDLLIARFTSGTRTWSAAQTLVRSSSGRVQRIGSDAAGNVLVLFIEHDGSRFVLKAIRVDHAGVACDTAQVIDSAVGGGAARADLGVDPLGQAMAIWETHASGSFDDGSLRRIAINRFDGTSWASAVFAETQLLGPGAFPRVSANDGQALLAWSQQDEGGGVARVRALLQPLANTPGQ